MAAAVPLVKVWELCLTEEEPDWCGTLTFSGPSGVTANNRSHYEQGPACAGPLGPSRLNETLLTCFGPEGARQMSTVTFYTHQRRSSALNRRFDCLPL